MEKVRIDLICKEHPELGEIGEETAEIALDAIRRVFGNLDLVQVNYLVTPVEDI